MAKLIKLENQESLDRYKGQSYLLWFTADWCGPCKRLKPFVEEILPRLPVDILIVDLTEDVETGSFIDNIRTGYQIRGIPSIQYIKGTEYFNLTEFFQKFQSHIILKLLQ